jgi:hypothetical protein
MIARSTENIGSDGSTPICRAIATGYRDTVAETVTINPALAIGSPEIGVGFA